MKILVIGGTQFVGLRLVWELYHKGHRITLLNRGKSEAVLPEGIERIYADRRKDSLQDKFTDSFDAVFDISGYYPKDIEIMIEALSGKTDHYIFCSTASVYQSTEIYPIKEDFPIWKEKKDGAPLYSDYGHNKVICEQMLLNHDKFHTTIIRPMYIYGPFNSIYRERYLFDRILRGRPVLIPGNINNIIQFGHVDDLAKAFSATLKNEKTFGKSYNISGKEYVTLTGLTETIARAMGKEVKIIRYDSEFVKDIKSDYKNPVFPFDWTTNTFVDISLAINDLGWEPEYSLLKGMKHSFEWYLENKLDQVEPNLGIDTHVMEKVGISPAI